MRLGLLACVAVMAALTGSCATSAHDLGYALTERNGEAELIVALCGAEPPSELVVARAPTGGIQDPKEAQLADLPAEDILFEVDESEWESDEQVFALGDVSDAPPAKQGVMIYTKFSGAMGRSSGWASMPDAPWPTHPLALTSPFAYERPVRLDTERGDLCDPG